MMKVKDSLATLIAFIFEQNRKENPMPNEKAKIVSKTINDYIKTRKNSEKLADKHK